MTVLATRDQILATLAESLPHIEQHFHVRSLSIFGSAACETLTPASDVDVLVEFALTPGFIEYMQLKFYLESLLGRKVDLVTSRALKPRIPPQIKQEAIHVTRLSPVS